MPSERSCTCASASELSMATARMHPGQLRRAPVVDAQHHQGGVESRPPLRPTGVFLAVVRRRDRHRRAPGGANVDGLQAVAPHPPGQVAHEGARRVANRGGAHRALQHGGEEGAEELVRDGPQLLFALLRFLCRPGRWSTRLKLQRPPEGSAQVDGNVAKIDLAARGVDGALVHFNAPSWAVRAVMSSTTLPVCPKTGSTSPSLTVHLCLHTAPGNRECAHTQEPRIDRSRAPGGSLGSMQTRRGTSGPNTSGRPVSDPANNGIPTPAAIRIEGPERAETLALTGLDPRSARSKI